MTDRLDNGVKASGVMLSFGDVVERSALGKSTSAETARKWMKTVWSYSNPTLTLVCKADVEADPKSNTDLQGFVVQ